MSKATMKMVQVTVTDNTTKEVRECMSKADAEAIKRNVSRMLSMTGIPESNVIIEILPLNRGAKA